MQQIQKSLLYTLLTNFYKKGIIIMIIKPFRKYVVLCKGFDQKIYRWHLKVEPWYKAWKVVNQDVQVRDIFKGYLILSIEDVIDTPYEEKFDNLKLWEIPILKKELDFIVEDSERNYDDQSNGLG